MSESDTDTRPLLDRVGRASGVAGGGVALALWGLFVTRVALPGTGSGSGLLAALMMLVAAATIVAASKGRGGALVLLALVSLVPVGLYLMATPSIYAGIGLANLVGLGGGVSLLAANRGRTERS